MRALVLFAVLAAGCSGGSATGPTVHASGSGSHGCSDEPASEGRASLVLYAPEKRGDLEVAMRGGLVAVHRDECGRIEIVRECRVEASSYRYEGQAPTASTATEHGLHVATVTAGTYRADTASVSEPKLVGPGCSRATHIVTAISIGAYRVTRSGEHGGLGVGGGGGSAMSGSSDPVASDGEADACEKSGTQPTSKCSAPLEVELTPVKQPPTPPVPGTAKQGIETGIIAPQ